MSLTDSGTSSLAAAWDRYSSAYQNAARLPVNVVSYGPNVGTEADFKMHGSVTGKRVIDLGCGGGQNAIAFARAGAISIGIDISSEQLGYAKRLVEQDDIKVELRQGDLADLAFSRADTVDLVFSSFAFQYAPDLQRVFRQVHRVTKPNGLFVFSIPHPVAAMTGATSPVLLNHSQLQLDPSPQWLTRSYFDKSTLVTEFEGETFTEYARSISDITMGLIRIGYRIEMLLEPESKDNSPYPSALIIRARKEA